MANVFLSYAREDSARAATVARALSAQGWKVWWDRTIPPGKTFDDVIEEALDHAGCVVVLWSKASTSSHWVRAEAAEGMRRGILVPALLEDVKIPLEFRRVQAANLASWSGSPSDPEFEQFVQSIATLTQPATVASVGVPSPLDSQRNLDSLDRTPLLHSPHQPPAPRRLHVIGWMSGLAIIIAAAAGVLAWWIAPSWLGEVAVVAPKPLAETRPATPAASSGSSAAPSDSLREVPSLVGMSVGDARAQLERSGFVIGAVRESNTGGAAGTIAAQRPAAGERVNRGTTIDLVVVAAGGKPPSISPTPNSRSEARAEMDLEVPALTGLSIEVARDRLVRRGLTVGRITANPAADSERGVVLAQDPSAGTKQPRGAAVSLVIGAEQRSDKPQQVEVPTVVGLTVNGAVEVLQRARLQRGTVTRRATSVSTPGLVLTQNVRPGTPVPVGTAIDIVISEAPPASDRTSGRPSQVNAITNVRVTERSASEVAVDADVFYDGASGSDQIVLTASIMNGKTAARGTLTRVAPLRIGANKASVTASMSGTVAQVTSTDVNLCIRRLRSRQAPESIHCQTFPLARDWVLPMNKVTSFRAADVSTSELKVSVSLWYDGSLGTSRITLQACPRGLDQRTRVGGIRCGQAAVQVGPNRLELTMTKGNDAQMPESAAVEVCLVGPRYFECQVFPHQRRWMAAQ